MRNTLLNNKNEEIKNLKKVVACAGIITVVSGLGAGMLVGVNNNLKDELTVKQSIVESLEKENQALLDRVMRLEEGLTETDIVSQYEIRQRIEREASRRDSLIEAEQLKAEKESKVVAKFDAELTAYYPDDSLMEGGFKTATGHDLEPLYFEGKRIIAVTKEIPLYSLVNITDEAGNTYECIALDRGGRIKGNKIDIVHKDRESANKFGVQIGQAEIIRLGRGE